MDILVYLTGIQQVLMGIKRHHPTIIHDNDPVGILNTENPLGYDKSPIGRAAQLHGALLICHGLADDNVHYRNTADYTKALIQADKDYSQLVYTDCNHSINGGNSRNHLFRQCVSFFKRELK